MPDRPGPFLRQSTPLAPLAALDALRVHVAQRIAEGIASAGPVTGPFIATEDAARLAARLSQPAATPADPMAQALLAALADPATTTGRLAQVFALDEAALALVTLTLLPDLTPDIAALYAWAQDDAQRRLPSAALACHLFGLAPPRLLAALAADAPLLAHGLLSPAAEGLRPLLDRALSLAPALSAQLLGACPWSALDPELHPHSLALPDLPLDLLTEEPVQPQPGTTLVVIGPPGSGRLALAVALVRAEGQTPRAFDLPGLLAQGHAAPFLALSESRRIGARPILAGAQSLAPPDLARILALAPDVILLSDRRLPPPAPGMQVQDVTLSPPDRFRMARIWSHALGTAHAPHSAALAQRFRLPLADLLAVAQQVRAAPSQYPDLPALTRACLTRAPKTLDHLANRLTTALDWDDLVIPDHQRARLTAILHRLTHAATVHDAWGFGRALTPDRGLSALFTGPSGTGKSLSAAVIAGRLGLPLYRVDLSATVSKFIGETEKQLEQIFTAAEAAHACLFFDEADALFGKRSEVEDAHDRYANIETSYLLQRLETHRGIVFLATNHPQNMDEAFTRRIDIRVDFTLPDAKERAQIWSRLMPVQAGAQIDATRLGAQFELSGGAIRNALVTAAFLAAEAGQRITTEHCLAAVAVEYEKMGRPLTRADFGAAWPDLRARRGGRDG